MTRHRGESGETLIEVLLAVAIMGVVMVGLIAGLTTAGIAGDSHRHLTDVEVVARAYGESVVDRAAHPLTTTLSVDKDVGVTALPVASSTGFVAGSSASVDGEVVAVQSVASGTLTLSAATTNAHAAGSTITVYQACPAPADLAVVSFTHGAVRVGTPVISLVEYLGPPATAGGIPPLIATSAAPGLCSTYWSTTGRPCSLDAAPPHYTVCDPPLLRISVTVTSTEAATSSRRTTTTTQVLVNRGNA